MSGSWYKSLRWNDVRFPATGLNPIGSAKPPTIDTDDGTLLFSGNSENSIAAAFQIDHGIKIGLLHPHIHYERTTAAAGNPSFSLEYKIKKIFHPSGNWVTFFDNGYSPVRDNIDAGWHNIQAFGYLDIKALDLIVSDMIMFRMTRHGDTDSYGGNIKLLEFDVHAQFESNGSVHEFG